MSFLKWQSNANSRQIPRDDSYVFGCVADSNGTFVEQAARLLLSLRWFGGSMSNCPFFLAMVGDLTPEQNAFFERHGARVFPAERFDDGHGPSNKLRFFEIDRLDEYDTIVLLDCDTVIVQNPLAWLSCEGFAAKPADLPTVSEESLSSMLRAFNLPVPDREFRHDVADVPCLPYFNSGVIILRSKWRRRFIRSWTHFDRVLIKDSKEFGIPPFHVDQASLTCAILALEIPILALTSCMNFPAHLPIAKYGQEMYQIDPVIIHYHWLCDSNGYIASLPLPRADLRARMFNARLRAERGGSDATQNNWSAPHVPKVVVGSGWWADDEDSEWAIGSSATRSVSFFDVWYRQVMKCISPDRIVITDSSSPNKPDWGTYPRVNWIELDRNYGHPNDVRTGKVKTKFSGYTRSVINGAMYAYCCDADYFVYIEQDCLVRGDEFLAKAIGSNKDEILLGARTEGGKGLQGSEAAPMLQNSLIIVAKSGLERFITGIINSPVGDGEQSIEVIMERHCHPFGIIEILYGRSRPIDFDSPCFYVQHLSDDELDRFLDIEAGFALGEGASADIFAI